MAFFAVLREGLETAVFMLAAFQASGDSTAAGSGAVLGVLVAVAIGWGIYRGGVRLDLARFFRVTAAVLVLVAAGLVATAIHTAHEATWLNGLQAQALDLSWLVRPGNRDELARHRRARRPAAADGRRGVRLAAVRHADAGVRVVARPLEAAGHVPRAGARQRRLARHHLTASTSGRQGVGNVESKRRRGAAVVALVAITAAGCGGGSSKAAPGATTVADEAERQGLLARDVSIPAGPVTFNVSNAGSSKVTEFELKNDKGIILGERENVVEGIDGSFSLTVDPGTYVLSCPNGDPPRHRRAHGDRQAHDPDTSRVSAAALARGDDRLPRLRRRQSAKLARGHEDVRRRARSRRPRRRRRASSGRCARTTSASSPSPRASAISTLRSTRASTTCRTSTSWTGFHRIERILWEQGHDEGDRGPTRRGCSAT